MCGGQSLTSETDIPHFIVRYTVDTRSDEFDILILLDFS